MGIDDKMKHKVDQVSGKAKETAGKVTDDEELETEGRLQHGKGEVAEDLDDLKDTAKKTTEHVKDTFKH